VSYSSLQQANGRTVGRRDFGGARREILAEKDFVLHLHGRQCRALLSSLGGERPTVPPAARRTARMRRRLDPQGKRKLVWHGAMWASTDRARWPKIFDNWWSMTEQARLRGYGTRNYCLCEMATEKDFEAIIYSICIIPLSHQQICVPCIVSTWHLFPTMYQARKCDPACQVKLLFHQTQAFYCCGSAQDSFPIYFLRLLISSIMCQERHDWICFFEAITEGRGFPPKYITPSDLYYSSLVWIYLSLKFI
jgi:hypothetical protein